MGNRAVITTDKFNENNVGIYLHWNGGRDSIEAFLKYCQLRGFRTPETDNYGWARLTQIIANFIGEDLSVGIDKCKNLDCDNSNNGVYLIKDWKITGRKYQKGTEQKEYKLLEMLLAIDKQQPKADRLGKEKIEKLIT